MDSTNIGDYLQDTHDKMIYVYDVFNERLFFIELVEILKQDSSITYPVCSFEKGQAPEQVNLDAIFNSQPQEESTPLDQATLDDEMFNEEDLDNLGFDHQISDDSLPDED